MATQSKLLFIVCLRFTGHGYCLEGRTYCQGERYRGNEESCKGSEYTLETWNADTVDYEAAHTNRSRQTEQIDRQTTQTEQKRQTDRQTDSQTDKQNTDRQNRETDSHT